MEMVKDLTQHKGWIRKECHLIPDGLHFHSRILHEEADVQIPYTRIMSRSKILNRTERYPLILQITAFLVAVGVLRSALIYPSNFDFLLGVCASLLLGLVGFLVFRLVKTEYIGLPLDDEEAIFFLRNHPSEMEVQQFFDAIYQARREFIRKEFFFIDYEGERRSELSRMKWLRTENIISENEYLVVVDEINENLRD